MNPIEQLSEALAGAVALAGESVVRVEGRRRIASSGIVWGEAGLILTAHHTVERRPEVRLGLPDGGEAQAAMIGRDPATDVAVLRVEGGSWKALARAAVGQVRVGHLVLAVGRPGESVQASLGIVSALQAGGRMVLGGRGEAFVQTDVVMYPGFSGGPLIDARGGWIGMNTSALARGVPLAVGLPTLDRVVKAVVEHGGMRRGYLGVVVQPVRLPSAPSGRPGQETGLLVASVEAGGPAQAAGVLLGDVLLGLEEDPLTGMEDLLMALGEDRVGKKTRLAILRAGKPMDVTVVPAERRAPSEDE